MSLLDRLRPQWQHSDPDVRLAAVRQMGDQDQQLLGSLAVEDTDPRVRRIALKKIGDPSRLQQIAEGEPDKGLQELARSRAAEILVERATSADQAETCESALSELANPRDIVRVAIGAQHADVRRAALARLSEEKALAEVITKANDLELRQQALGRLTDSSMLQRIASNGTETELALTALEKIDDPNVLHAISEERGAHKIVRQRACTRLEDVLTDDHPLRVQARQERQEQLCGKVEAIVAENTSAGTLETSLDDANDRLHRVETLHKEWDDLAAKTVPTEELRQRFDNARQTVADHATRIANRQAEAEKWIAEREEGVARRLELCQQIDALDGQDAATGLEQIRRDWQNLAPLPAPLETAEAPELEAESGEALQQRFARAVERCEQRAELWKAHQTFQTTLDQLLVDAEKTAESKLADAIRDWPAVQKRWSRMEASLSSEDVADVAVQARERFAKANDRLLARQQERAARKEKVRKENLERLEKLCTRLDKLTQSKELRLKAADRALRDAAESLKQIGPLPSEENPKDWKKRLFKARQELFQRFQEQRETEDWKRWANVDQQEKLIQRTEALRDVTDLATVAKELRLIQDEWKRAGAVPKGKSESLWRRYREARDELWSRCETYFADNLKKKEELCEQIERLASSTDWNKTAEQIKRIQQEWKSIGPVPLRQTKPTWKRFRKPCDEFFTKRNAHLDTLKTERLENAKKKAGLCQRAESLADSTDWEKAATELKSLQAEWKKIGPAPHKKSEALWNRFRKACDHFFDRRKHRGEIELAESLQEKEAACVELESIAASIKEAEAPPSAAVGEQIREAWDRWAAAGSVPADKEAPLRGRLERACSEIVTVLPESLAGTPLDPRANHKRREKLCARLEELVEHHAPDRSHDDVQDVAEKLKQALAANTIGGAATPKKKSWKATLQEAERLRENWERLGPVIDPRDRGLADRFESAYARLARRRRDSQESQKSATADTPTKQVTP